MKQMKNKLFLFVLVFLFIHNFALANQSLQPNQSQCLESVTELALDRLGGELHVFRDPSSGLVAAVVNLDTGERFDLENLTQVDASTEFLSFANVDHFLNIFARRNAGPTCTLESAEILPNKGGHRR